MEEREKQVNSQIDTLLNKIEGLLPGATAAGLSESYDKAEKSAQSSIKTWTTCFILSIITICTTGWLLYWAGIISFSPDMSTAACIIQILRIACFASPFIWLCVVANIKISQYTRLDEEYRHKWASMRMFEAMRSILRENDSEEAEKTRDDFYHVLLESFAENPSKILDKKYNPEGPFSLFHWFKSPTKIENSKSQNENTEN